jgi:ubiquinone/menaquinone biosynthesis C-methylase UbiE
MVDRLFSDPDLAALYDTFCQGRPDFSFYLPLVMSAEAVLDVGCGTGELLRLARQAGHTGRLCGLDPANAMLDVARTRSDIEWVLGDVSSVTWDQEFDLVVMTGHAFQVFIDDDEIRAALTAIRSVLAGEGHFVFETRNPQVREWEHWTLKQPIDRTGPGGVVIQYSRAVQMPVEGDLVHFTQTYSHPSWERPKESSSTLRFLGTGALASFLSSAGLAIEKQFGNWDRQPLADTSPEIITIAKRSA